MKKPNRKMKRVEPMLLVETLEARLTPSMTPAMQVGMNIENVRDYNPAWMFTDAFKASRPWMPQLYNTVTHTLTQDLGHLLPLSPYASS